MDINYEHFQIKDYDQAYSLWKICEGIGLSGADEHDKIAFYLDRNPNMSFLAKVDDKVIGTILCGYDGRRGFIHHLAVHPDYRHKGIGKTLVKFGLDSLREVGIVKCHLFLLEDNHNGKIFWEKIGWKYRQDIAVMSCNL